MNGTIPVNPISEADMSSVSRKVAQQFLTRANAFGYRGKKRDELAIEFVLGAATALQVTGNSAAMNSVLLLATLVSVRGYSWLEEYANEPIKPTFTEE